jgi:protein-L-isoaspartate(D-aspartate) O-methyltransferase
MPHDADYNDIDSGMMKREELFEHLRSVSGVFRDPLVAVAFEAVDRRDFVSADYRSEAYEDYAIPIGYGQTISQPTTVAFMLELLGAAPGDTVLDVGSGSGWTTALLASIVGPEGSVTGIEIVPELVADCIRNLEKYSTGNVHISDPDGKLSLEGYDRILVSAAFPEWPGELLADLAAGAVIVIPVKDSLFRVERTPSGLDKKEFPGFVFVPYVL